jgi:hypothetical protein
VKLKHNKRRNTAFLFEALVREMTKCVVDKDAGRKENISNILKEHFKQGTELAKELRLYRTLYETRDVDQELADRLISEVKRMYMAVDRNRVFQEQSALISTINRSLSKSVYSNFVPNYKSLATIAQIFNDEVPVKSKILLERQLAETIVKDSEDAQLPRVSNLVFKTFVKKFNEKYSKNLHENQERLIKTYINSLEDDVELKLYLNEELGRIKTILEGSLSEDELKEDSDIRQKTEKVLSLIESYKEKKVNEKMLVQVLQLQNLTNEIQQEQ